MLCTRSADEIVQGKTVQAAAEAGVEGAAQAMTLMARTATVWERQLQEQSQERDARLERGQRSAHAAEPVKDKKRVRDPNCAACQGKHRAHTCK